MKHISYKPRVFLSATFYYVFSWGRQISVMFKYFQHIHRPDRQEKNLNMDPGLVLRTLRMKDYSLNNNSPQQRTRTFWSITAQKYTSTMVTETC